MQVFVIFAVKITLCDTIFQFISYVSLVHVKFSTTLFFSFDLERDKNAWCVVTGPYEDSLRKACEDRFEICFRIP